MVTRNELLRAAAELGFAADTYEKVWMLLRTLNLLVAHPFLGSRVVLKGGTALNLFLFDVPRLSVDIDVNYVGAADRKQMLADRPKAESALQQVAGRLGLSVKRAPDAHAGGKWRLGYVSVLGRPAVLEVDVNFMLRVPLWPTSTLDSADFLGVQAKAVPVLDRHELAAGKLAALVARGAARDLFDSRALLSDTSLDLARLRLAFVVYGGINRLDWRGISAESVTTSAEDVRRKLLPVLRLGTRPPDEEVERWTLQLVEETQRLLGAVLPLNDAERSFLDHLNGAGELRPELLTKDAALQDRILRSPGLRWKALNVKKHTGGGSG